jgi:hypothetical protein
MTMEKSDSKRLQELRERRMRNANEKERVEKRAKLGNEIAVKLGKSLGVPLSIASFDAKGRLPIEFKRKPSFADCRGLVAAHISENRARQILACCDAKLGKLGGILTCDEYAFVGVAHLSCTTLAALLGAAKALHDSVLFCPDESDSIVLVDHYRMTNVSRDVGFSVVVQGNDLEVKLASCFDNLIQLKVSRR